MDTLMQILDELASQQRAISAAAATPSVLSEVAQSQRAPTSAPRANPAPNQPVSSAPYGGIGAMQPLPAMGSPDYTPLMGFGSDSYPGGGTSPFFDGIASGYGEGLGNLLFGAQQPGIQSALNYWATRFGDPLSAWQQAFGRPFQIQGGAPNEGPQGG